MLQQVTRVVDYARNLMRRGEQSVPAMEQTLGWVVSEFQNHYNKLHVLTHDGKRAMVNEDGTLRWCYDGKQEFPALQCAVAVVREDGTAYFETRNVREMFKHFKQCRERNGHLPKKVFKGAEKFFVVMARGTDKDYRCAAPPRDGYMRRLNQMFNV